MKVQGINNQNSISHKAYFKPNTEFKKLWAYKPSNMEVLHKKIARIKNGLPNHEIEIIDSGRAAINEKLSDFYLLFNNVTKKAFGVAIVVSSVKNHLETVLDSLLEQNDKTKNFFESDDSNLVEFDKITKAFHRVEW